MDEGLRMLKGIPGIISPELMKALMEMGHGDELVLADANFPAASLAQRLVRADGHSISSMLEAILQFFPLDQSVHAPVVLMKKLDHEAAPVIWDDYGHIVKEAEPSFLDFTHEERFSFYERA